MADTQKSARWFRQVAEGVQRHDATCKFRRKAYAVRMAYIDIEDVGWEVGDTIYPGVRLEAGGQKGRMDVICGGDHGHPSDSEEAEEGERETTNADSGRLERIHRQERELVKV